jgi:hypothetical protein
MGMGHCRRGLQYVVDYNACCDLNCDSAGVDVPRCVFDQVSRSHAHACASPRPPFPFAFCALALFPD